MEPTQLAGEPLAAAQDPLISESPKRIGVVGEILFSGVAVAAAIARSGRIPRVLTPDAQSSAALAERLPAGAYEVVAGNLGDPGAIQATLDGTYAAAFISPIAMSGRLYRPDTHVEDVRRFIHAAERNTLRSVVYHSSTAARATAGSRSLRDAAAAEELIHTSRSTEYRLSTGPLMGKGDGFLSTLVPRVRSSSPFMGVLGYGNAEFQPLHVEDFAACVARVFSTADPIPAGVYGLSGPEVKSWLELMDDALELVGGMKLKFHAPLFIAKLASLGYGKKWAEEVGLSQERFGLERSDTQKFLASMPLKTSGEVLKELLTLP